MNRVRRSGTSAELRVRQILSSFGARYRVNVRDARGRTDIANRRRGKAILVHGCFWHAHDGCRRASIPKSNVMFWTKKLEENKARDQRKVESLAASGFQVMIVWECELDDEDMPSRLRSFWFREPR
jgi:DNA mismatch endonuclease (patch repair protein)